VYFVTQGSCIFGICLCVFVLLVVFSIDFYVVVGVFWRIFNDYLEDCSWCYRCFLDECLKVGWWFFWGSCCDFLKMVGELLDDVWWLFGGFWVSFRRNLLEDFRFVKFWRLLANHWRICCDLLEECCWVFGGICWMMFCELLEDLGWFVGGCLMMFWRSFGDCLDDFWWSLGGLLVNISCDLLKDV